MEELEYEFEHTLEDGRVARLAMLSGHFYSNSDITAGYAEGIEPDIIYLSLVRGDDVTLLFLRPDEAQAVVHVLSGAMTAYLVDCIEADDAIDNLLDSGNGRVAG